jgi:hypothetical protein
MSGSMSRAPGEEFAGVADRGFGGIENTRGGIDALRRDVMDNTFLNHADNRGYDQIAATRAAIMDSPYAGMAQGVGQQGFEDLRSLRGLLDGSEGFGQLSSLRNDMMDNSFLQNLEASRVDGLNRLGRSHADARNAPFDQLRSSVDDLRALSAPGYSALQQGMDQFYGNVANNRSDLSPSLSSLSSGFNTSSNDIRNMRGDMARAFDGGMSIAGGALSGLGDVGAGLQGSAGALGNTLRGGMTDFGGQLTSGIGGLGGALQSGMAGFGDQLGSTLGGFGNQLGAGFGSTQDAIAGLWGNSMGNLPMFQTPLQQQQAQWELQDARLARPDARPAVNLPSNLKPRS